MEEEYYKVVMIPDSTRIIINAGIDEVSVGEEIEVFEKGIDILDNVTSEKIGRYDYVKDKLLITNVYESHSIARKQVEKQRPSLADIASPMLNSRTYLIYDEMNVNETDNMNIDLETKPIRIGDLVKII